MPSKIFGHCLFPESSGAEGGSVSLEAIPVFSSGYEQGPLSASVLPQLLCYEHPAVLRGQRGFRRSHVDRGCKSRTIRCMYHICCLACQNLASASLCLMNGVTPGMGSLGYYEFSMFPPLSSAQVWQSRVSHPRKEKISNTLIVCSAGLVLWEVGVCKWQRAIRNLSSPT